MFNSIYGSTDIEVVNLIWCLCSSILLGYVIALFYTYKCNYTKSFIMTLSVLPCAVAMVITLVNGNVGTGVAVAGAFSLVRFRSVPGSAREIGAIFIAMGSGIALGMGYIMIAFVFAILVSLSNVLIASSSFGDPKKGSRLLKITIPEDLNYTDAFDDIFNKYTNDCDLTFVKSTNMGSLFKLMYNVELKSNVNGKDFIDELRVRNGNLDVVLSIPSSVNEL